MYQDGDSENIPNVNVSSSKGIDERFRKGLIEAQELKGGKEELLKEADTRKEISPICNCVPSGYPENGPYYVHLGHRKTQEGLQEKFKKRLRSFLGRVVGGNSSFYRKGRKNL